MHPSIAKLTKQIEVAQNNKEFEKTIRLYQQLFTQTDPQTTDLDDATKEIRLNALSTCGSLLHTMGRAEEALKYYQLYYLECGTSKRSIDALTRVGDQQSRLGEHNRALGAHREALQLAKAFNNTKGRAQAYNGIGVALRGLGRIEESVPHAEKALALFQQIKAVHEQMRAGNLLAISYARLGKIDKAIAMFKQSLELARQVGARATSITLSNLGECYQTLYDLEQAHVYHQEAVTLYETTQMTGGSSDLYRNLGVDLYYLGRVDEGMDYLYQALEISIKEKRPNLTMQVLYSVTLAEIEQGDIVNAQIHTQLLQELAQENQATGYAAKALHLAGLCHQFTGNTTAAQQAWQQATILAQETGQQMLIWQLHAAQATISPTPELADIHNRIAAEIIEQIAYPIEDAQLRQKFLEAAPIHAVLSQV